MYVFHLLKQELRRITIEIKCPLETVLKADEVMCAG